MRPALHARARAARQFALPLRFAAANNYYPSLSQSLALQSYSTTVQQLQQTSHLITQDCTSITIGFPSQYMKAGLGITNIGNAISFQQFVAVYNSTIVNVTLGGSMPASVSDATNGFFDALSASSFGVAKFSKGTTIQLRCLVQTTAAATDKFPMVASGTALWGSTAAAYYFDPLMTNITVGVNSTSNVNYSMKSFTATGATASGTTVTATLASTTGIVSGNTYNMSGATGSGNALFYNCVAAVTVVNSTTVTYTAPGGSPAATMTGTLVIGARNNTDAKFGNALSFIILARHSLPAVGMLGDSKTYGTQDTVPTSGAIGMNRLLLTDPTTNSTVVWGGCNFGNPSGIASDPYTANGSGSVSVFEQWYAYMNYAVVGYGTNNTTTSYTTALHARLRANGISKLIQRSLTPRDATTTGTSITLTGATASGTTVTGTAASTAALVNGNTYTVAGATGSGNALYYNGSFVITVVNSTTITYTATAGSPAATATGTLTVQDQFRTVAGQTAYTGWSSGGLADTWEAFCRGLPASDANLTYYQSYGERVATSGAGYWQWKCDGTTAFLETKDGLHESAKGYEDNIRTTGSIITQSGTTSGTLAGLVQAFT